MCKYSHTHETRWMLRLIKRCYVNVRQNSACTHIMYVYHIFLNFRKTCAIFVFNITDRSLSSSSLRCINMKHKILLFVLNQVDRLLWLPESLMTEHSSCSITASKSKGSISMFQLASRSGSAPPVTQSSYLIRNS